MKNRHLILTLIFLACLIHKPVLAAETANSFVDTEVKNLFSDSSVKRLNDWGKFLLRDLDVEFITVVKQNLKNEPINAAANQIFEERKIGQKTKSRRGLLLLVAIDERLVRFEVGYDLEAVLPDAFVHYIERNQMKPFFEEGKVGQGVEATIEMIVTKLYEEIKSNGYDPKAKNSVQLAQFSGGGGAKDQTAVGIRSEPLRTNVSQSNREYFKPGKTPEETHAKYLESCKLGITALDLDIYSDADKKFFANRTVTPAQLQNYLKDYEGESFKIEISGDLAVLVYPVKKRYLMPVFLKKERGGWVLDFYTQFHSIKYNQNRNWFVKDYKNPYMFALNKYFYFGRLGYPYLKKGVKWDK